MFAHGEVEQNTEIDWEKFYKTKLCQQNETQGWCERGDQCLFAHGEAELKPM